MAETPSPAAPRDTNTAGNPLLDRAYALADADEARALYDEWADSYDDDLSDDSQGYVAPELAAAAVADAAGVDGEILDAGCGTGLVGVALASRGARTIDGVDLSPGMLAKAKETGVYRRLAPADLSRALPVPADAYDVVVCVGTLTHGHVGPGAFGEFVRLARPGGVIVATVLDDIWDSGGYRAEVDRLAQMAMVEVVSTDLVDYRKAAQVDARMVVLRVG
ncbi:class I SAM-dependent methyltransferase [Actinomycetospora sp. TBRC 11914]|uniref:class I SAM-dependent DNA methyltransferase n=1 Tax=Actinomycetospora sp. TBRC 11914 TaxID=2729387 RepID=UPI00145D4BC5|nr:class I SAM-dependent methyltransferase [Actinomycetospora sp. TBRC 11914]NMO89304.1 class I SAM-dependent methyltransferase [Actinomycetospora sp. TBRC 11914]